jgi:hypothetical protein
MTVASNVNQCLATIKGIEAQLSVFALNFQDDTAKRVLHESMMMMEEIKNELQARITELELEEPQYKNT